MKLNTPPLLQLSGVSKRFGPHEVLRDVSLQAHPHEFVAIVGPNGAGKSTLVELLAGLIVPDRGEIRIEGCRMRQDPPRALGSVGFVFQQSSLDLELSVQRNLRFHAALHGMQRFAAESRISELLASFNLADRASDKARVLSGGNRRRLELARALLPRPSILILDEPTVGLDPQMRSSLIEHAFELTRYKGLLVLWTTHLIDEAENADRLVVLKKGGIVFDGTPAAARAKMGTDQLLVAYERMTTDLADRGGWTD